MNYRAELKQRVGWWKRTNAIPTWFDEGMAMYLDSRDDYSIDLYQPFIEKGFKQPNLDQIDSPDEFWNGGDEQIKLNYIYSKKIFTEWYEEIGKAAFINYVDQIKNKNEVNQYFTSRMSNSNL